MSAIDAMEPRLLRSFIAVGEELHFGRAAKRLHISQPPLSVHIRTLEDRLGVRLFDRDRRHVVITEAGAFFLQRARYLLAEGERSARDAARIARGDAGILVIGYTPTATHALLPRALHAFRSRWPDVRLELVEMASQAQRDALRTERIDVGLACGPVGDAELVERVLSRERFILAVPHKHPFASMADVPLRALHGVATIAVRSDIEPAWAGAAASALERARVHLDVVQETDSKIALLGIVAAGIGVAIVSESMRALRRDGVLYKNLRDLKLRVPLTGLSRRQPSIRVSRFFDVVT